MKSEQLKFQSKGTFNSIRVQGGAGIHPNVVGVFSDDTVGLSAHPSEVRCFVEGGFFTMKETLIFLDEAALDLVHAFLTAQFKARGIRWGC